LCCDTRAERVRRKKWPHQEPGGCPWTALRVSRATRELDEAPAALARPVGVASSGTLRVRSQVCLLGPRLLPRFVFWGPSPKRGSFVFGAPAPKGGALSLGPRPQKGELCLWGPGPKRACDPLGGHALSHRSARGARRRRAR
jgi:hypothetical protein